MPDFELAIDFDEEESLAVEFDGCFRVEPNKKTATNRMIRGCNV